MYQVNKISINSMEQFVRDFEEILQNTLQIINFCDDKIPSQSINAIKQRFNEIEFAIQKVIKSTSDYFECGYSNLQLEYHASDKSEAEIVMSYNKITKIFSNLSFTWDNSEKFKEDVYSVIHCALQEYTLVNNT